MHTKLLAVICPKRWRISSDEDSCKPAPPNRQLFNLGMLMIHQTFNRHWRRERKKEKKKSAVSVAGKTHDRAHVSIEAGLLDMSSCPSKLMCLRFPHRLLRWLRGIFCGRAKLLERSQRERTAAEIIVLLVIPLLCCTVIRSSSFKIHHRDWMSPEDSIHSQVTSYFLTGTRLSVGG